MLFNSGSYCVFALLAFSFYSTSNSLDIVRHNLNSFTKVPTMHK